MNREILFKAKTKQKDSGEFDNVWVIGNLIVSGEKYYIHPAGNIVSVVNELGRLVVMHEVIPETICQYTGLTDKNGKKIWENDIVKLPELYGNEVGVVEYLCCGFRVRNSAYGSTQLCGEEIGNIFDNPELLKGGAEG